MNQASGHSGDQVGERSGLAVARGQADGADDQTEPVQFCAPNSYTDPAMF